MGRELSAVVRAARIHSSGLLGPVGWATTVRNGCRSGSGVPETQCRSSCTCRGNWSRTFWGFGLRAYDVI